MKNKNVKIGDDLFQMMCEFEELSNSEIYRRNARKVYRNNIDVSNITEGKLQKPVHVVPVELPDCLYNVSPSDVRKAMRLQLGRVRQVGPIYIDQADMKYPEFIKSRLIIKSSDSKKTIKPIPIQKTGNFVQFFRKVYLMMINIFKNRKQVEDV